MEMEALFTYLKSQQNVQEFLFSCYGRDAEAERKSYENCSAFLYCLDHGLRFYENGKQADPAVQPVLLFYGMVHLLKAVLLTERPEYPESAALLAHGVTTRKRKKKHFAFMEDEVKVQQQGFYPYFAEHLYAVNTNPSEKYSMDLLFSLVPELSSYFDIQQKQRMAVVGRSGSRTLSFPASLLDGYHLTEPAFLGRISPSLPEIGQTSSDRSTITVELLDTPEEAKAPFYLHQDTGELYFPILREYCRALPEQIIHYLILFSLSMLCRYESEWWGELLALKTEGDYSFITQFLQVTSRKMPAMIANELRGKL